MPTGISHQPDHLRSSGRHARKNKYLTTGSLQDRDMPIDMRIRNIKGDANDNHASQIAETLLNSLVQVATELIVLPEDHDLAVRIKCLRPSARNDGCQPIVQGKALGSISSSAPEATKSWGIFLSFRKPRTARFPGVP